MHLDVDGVVDDGVDGEGPGPSDVRGHYWRTITVKWVLARRCTKEK